MEELLLSKTQSTVQPFLLVGPLRQLTLARLSMTPFQPLRRLSLTPGKLQALPVLTLMLPANKPPKQLLEVRSKSSTDTSLVLCVKLRFKV